MSKDLFGIERMIFRWAQRTDNSKNLLGEIVNWWRKVKNRSWICVLRWGPSVVGSRFDGKKELHRVSEFVLSVFFFKQQGLLKKKNRFGCCSQS